MWVTGPTTCEDCETRQLRKEFTCTGSDIKSVFEECGMRRIMVNKRCSHVGRIIGSTFVEY